MQKGGNMDNDKFRDWIPAGEDTGAITQDGFQDFVPAPQPKPQVIHETVEEPVQPVQPVIEEQPQVPPLEQEGVQDGSA